MIRTVIRNLVAIYRPRAPRRSSARLRPALMALEERVRLHPASSNEYFFWKH